MKNKLLAPNCQEINQYVSCVRSFTSREGVVGFYPIFGQRLLGARLRMGKAVARGRALLQSPVAFQPCSTSVGSLHFVVFWICGFCTAVVIVFIWVLSL